MSGTEYTVVNLIDIVPVLMDLIVQCGRKTLNGHTNTELQVVTSAEEKSVMI